ncbi:ABC tran domain containing protein [Asbolus verrucosus]|uniref:ABC tran domain containing protein n=1 Tax=Asbolus verrucosus TaxID=1661398 RepID=A0A482VCL5_ASBVE|nr:ABC tran domain containing protein [Asbolus verrucosus]
MFERTDERYQMVQEALSSIKIIKMYAAGYSVSFLSIDFTLYILLISYLMFGNNITAEVAFFVVSCCDMLILGLSFSFLKGLYFTAELASCIKRLQNLFDLPNCKIKPEVNVKTLPIIRFDNVALKIGDKEIFPQFNLQIEKGLTLITGRVSSGKTSLLKLILQEYQPETGTLQIQGSVSYASQKPWLFPSTIRQNILFGEVYDEKRYQQVLQVCALAYDLEMFDCGDLTIVEDQGLNLSKGQQIRINLARAVYKQAEIYLLDDSLTGLDAQVASFIFKECFQKYLGEKLVTLVTNNTNYLNLANNVIFVSEGELKSVTNNSATGILRDAEDNKTEEISYSDNINEEEEGIEDSLLISKSNAKNKVYKEDNKVGKVDSDVYTRFIKLAGGFVMVNIEEEILNTTSNNGVNGTNFNKLKANRDNILYLYNGVILAVFAITMVNFITYLFFVKRVSINIHRKMLISVLNASMQFFDKNFTGNILNRFSKDFVVIDEMLPIAFTTFLRKILSSNGKTFKKIRSSIEFIFLVKSPVVGYMNATLEGLTTIRAAYAENILTEEFHHHQNIYISTSYTVQCCTFAFTFVLEILCISFIAAIIIRYLITTDVNNLAGNVGLVISQASRITETFQAGVRQWAEIENYMTSVERVLQYTDVEQENKSGLNLENWPKRGEVKYQNVSLTYIDSKQPTLKKINFIVKPNEKIGIVGRTGAGKSSLTSTIFRLYKHKGKITIDDTDINTLSLEFLRSKISVIPQDAVIFTGTIRDNIDPMSKCTDEEIWYFLECVHLKEIIPNLDFKIAENDGNFSAGQKQLICLARAMARKNKIVVMDEATANLDPESDILVHDVIEKYFVSSTVFVVAHKLRSILKCDQVIVLDKGEIVEYGKLAELLQDENGFFYKMVREAGLTNNFVESNPE